MGNIRSKPGRLLSDRNYLWRVGEDNIYRPADTNVVDHGFLRRVHYFFTFAFENMNFLRGNDTVYFFTYTIASVVLGIAAVFAGIAIMKFL